MVKLLYQKSISELHDLLVRSEVSAADITRSVLDRVDQVEGRIKAYVTVTAERALAVADEVDKKLAAGEKMGPLAGIPMALKDNMCTRGVRTTCSSRILENFVPPYNATVVEKLAGAGSPVIGKTNLDEFAMGSSTENSAFFTTSNPWNPDLVPGGSSGGSAAAVAAGEAIYALGSDTGGSIRQPASFCGVVGMKPTYGLVSRYGLVAFASSLDQIGPLTRNVTDCALVLQAIAGPDERDSTCAPGPVPNFAAALTGDVRGIRVGVPKEYLAQGVDPRVAGTVQAAIDLLAAMGAEVEETSLPHTSYALPVYYLIAPAEASSNLARYDGVRYGYRAAVTGDVVDMFMRTRSEGFGAEVKRRIMLGTYALSAGYYDAYYLKALKVRTLIKQDFDRAFERYDVLLTPTSPTLPFKKGERTMDPVAMYLSDICTLAAPLAGIPALSLTCGFVDDLPVGLQLMGPPFGEQTLLRVAHAYEQKAGHWRRSAEGV
ncbi:MAG TPA: Asp-tRNA(Asn)/Glu-tRNA(Gln) amidotransferase subunit GatA [Spirochaetia bacterium]|nr:Asp-tRNA(Asn)/Glu-tRNA(Gln) amidotransferase subunit GatA [Spirochaetia bacterium]